MFSMFVTLKMAKHSQRIVKFLEDQKKKKKNRIMLVQSMKQDEKEELFPCLKKNNIRPAFAFDNNANMPI